MTNKNRRQALMLLMFLAAILTLASGREAHLQTQEAETVITGDEPFQTFVVTSANDSGAGTLRQAITDANASPGLDMITFNISGTGIRSIFITSMLPTVTDPVLIDGTTQPGYAGSPLIAIRAQLATQALNITSGGTTVKGMSFTGFFGTTSNIITLSGPGNNRVSACYFGILGNLTRPGMTANSLVIDASNNNLIGGSTSADRNYFESDSGYHIIIKNGAASNRVAGNWFGTGPTANRLALQREPVRIEGAPNNIIGGSVGTTPGGACTGECNVITGNQNGHGIYILNAASTGNRVLGNFIGVFADGMNRNENSNDGIKIENAPGNFIGGTSPAERNVIAGNTVNEIEVTGAGSTGNVISGNYIGILTDGVATLAPNSSAFIGITLGGSSASTRIGGVTAGERNIVSGSRNGMSISAPNTLIQGNYVGTNAAGTAASTTVGSGIALGSSNNTIGGTEGTTLGGACTGACNVISGNGQDGLSAGIVLVGANANAIDGNYIGLNAEGTEAIVNGRNPGGTLYNGNAIALFNSNNNMIGRQMSEGPAPAQEKERSGEQPLTAYCIQSSLTGDYVSFSDTPGNIGGWEAKHCKSGRTLTGHGTISYLPNGSAQLNSSIADDGSVKAIAGAATTASSANVIFPDPNRFEMDIGLTRTNGSCECPPGPGMNTIAGPIKIGDPNEPSSNNWIQGSLLGKKASGTSSLNELFSTRSQIKNVLGNNNVIRNVEIAAREIEGIVLESGTGITIDGCKIETTARPISVASGANGGGEAPQFLTINRTPEGFLGVRLRGTLHGLPNQIYRIEFYADDLDYDPFLGFDREYRPLDLSFQITTDANGMGSFDRVFNDSNGLHLLATEYLTATATAIIGVLDGSTSMMSDPINVPIPQFDFDFDGKTDIGVVRPNLNLGAPSFWYILNSSNYLFQSVQFGSGGDQPTAGDYNGDLLTNLAVWRPGNGFWYIGDPTGDPSTHFTGIPWGLSTDTPVRGDFDGDGRYDLGVFRPSDSFWYIRTSLGGGLLARQWGLGTDKLAPGDYNGDGKTDLAVFRDGYWYISVCANCPPLIIAFGLQPDIPTPGDFDGDGKTDVAVFRPSTGIWYVQGSAVGFFGRQWGQNGDVPLKGNFDGDNKDDIAVWRPKDGNFYILQSGNGLPLAIHWGQNGDIPVPTFGVQFH